MLDVDQHIEHYIACPGGRDANGNALSFIYAFDLADEKWTATTFPEMQKPMFNMDAKVVELADKTHQLIILSGQIASGFSNIIQGYNFEKNYIQNVVDTGAGGLNFAGRPALAGEPMLRNGFIINRPDGELDFLRSLIVVGGSERSCFIRGTTSAIDSVLFSVQGSTLALGMPYETTTLNNALSNTGNTGLPFGFFDYRTYASQAGAVGTKLQNQGTFTRHQNLPVRGILRRRPIGNINQASNSNPVIDFLLIGGFNIVGREAYNNKIVSGIFHSPTASAANSAQYSMLIQNPHFSANNTNSLLYYPDYCINLLRRPDRWTQFQAEIKKAKFCFASPQRFTAVDGHHTGGNHRYCTGAWACLQSHLRIIELSVVHNQSPYLVFEDDAILHPQFNEKVQRFLEHLPDDWGLAYLGGQHLHRDAQDLNDYVAVPYNVNRTHCFAVRGTMRRRLYEMLVNDEYFHPDSGHIDHTLGRWIMTQPGGVYCPAKGEWFVGQAADHYSDISAKTNLERKTWSKIAW